MRDTRRHRNARAFSGPALWHPSGGSGTLEPLYLRDIRLDCDLCDLREKARNALETRTYISFFRPSLRLMLALLCASSGLAVGSKSFVSKPFVRRCSALTLKDEDGSWSLKSSVPMPDKLAEWGCDDTLWSQVRSKQPLIDFAEAGDENAARERIAMLRASPSITGAGAHAPLPENIASMGCDAELWSKVRSKQALIDLAAGGNEEQVHSQAPVFILTSSCPWR